VAQWIESQGRLQKGERSRLAGLLAVTARTLHNWRREAARGEPEQARPGRPVYAPELVYRVLRRTRRELKRQGWSAGWRSVLGALGGEDPVRLVQRCLALWKRRKRRRLRLLRGGLRKTILVQAREVLWSIDAMQAGHNGEGEARFAEVLRDVGGARTISIRIGPASKAQDVIALLESARRTRGALPLVLSSDNGSAYASDLLERYLEEHRVVHLRSLPHTPQHNAWAEHGIGELRAESGLESHTPLLGGDEEAALRLEEARRRLDGERYRLRFGSTAEARDKNLPRGYDGINREAFYCDARKRMETASLCHENRRDQRRAEREAILLTLEGFNLIERTQGDGQRGTPKAEIVS